MTPKDKLLIYIRGWKRGCAGAAWTEPEMADSVFKAGWAHGRADSSKMYKFASRLFKAQLSPLREGEKFPVIVVDTSAEK